MSKIVTFEQAKRLQALGISIVSDCGYVGYTKSGELVSRLKFKEDRDYQLIPSWIRVFTVSEAIDWVRDEKGIECGVHPYAIYEDMPDGDQHFVKWGYKYVAFQGLSEWQNMDKEVFDTHHLAESALLDAVLTYLEQK